MVVSLMPAVRAAESTDTVEIKFLVTSDIHGQLYATLLAPQGNANRAQAVTVLYRCLNA